MDSEQVSQDLNRRFAEPLPDFYRRRIIFWKDADREFEEKLPEITLENAKLVALTGTNNFAVKKLLTVDDTTSNYLVYFPEQIADEDNWLLPIELYSEEFRADLISMWMDEMGMGRAVSLRKQIKDYRNFFKNKGHRAKVANLKTPVTTPAQLHLAVMAVLCGLKDFQPNGIIRSVFTAWMNQDTNDIYQKFVDFGAKDAFWAMVAQAFGYREEEGNLGRLAAHILLTAATRTMHPDYLAGLDGFISSPHQAYCYDFVSEWMHSDENMHLYKLAQDVEEEIRLPSRFEKLPVKELAETELFPCIHECILTSLMTEIRDQIINVDTITAMVEKRRTCAWYELVKDYYEGILQVANMQAFFLTHSAGFHTVEARKIWKEYTEDYYMMDTYYRRFHVAFSRSLKSPHPLLEDLFKHVADNVEGLYETWYLAQLGSNWSTAAAEELARYGRILEVPQQVDFYRDKIKNADTRIFVIISDALRYEVAVTLTEQLRRETQAKVVLNSCSAIFPTVTKFGMAALLPHEKLTVEENANGLSVHADGTSTDVGYRDAILKKANPASIAVKYKDIVLMKRQERSERMKGNKVVYIYHNKIDETSHTDEALVFPSCEETIDEIKNMVRIIVNEFGGVNILITADHGFLYTYSPLSEDGKVDKTTVGEEDVEVDRRYLVTRKGAKPQYLLPVKFVADDANYDAFSPRESIRIKKKGGGLNFVHGGISLQEMVVPVVEYHYLRNRSKEYQQNKMKYDTKPVSLNLLSTNRKICNMIFSLNFYQKEPVGDNREAATYLLYFVDSEGKQVSDTQKIIADKQSQNNQDRTFRCSFNLKSLKFSNKETYYLVIADETGLQLPQREEFTIDIAFAVDEFDFFS
ncbi:MAG: BREX-1 system phosphatase PglZ type A [Planctomycetia bacterium]|nr:BREX-1 system phosphatase PglZ type A [Planctomycetia bacterium]